MPVRPPRCVACLVFVIAIAAFAPAAWASFAAGPTAPLDPVKFAAVGDQDQVAAADNGTVSLFAWRDKRHDPAGDLFVARVNHAGQVLDPNGIEIAAGTGAEGQPALAWDGAHWLLAWTDVDAVSGKGTVRAERVGTDGQPADAAPIALSTPGADASHPAVAWNGALWIVAWQEVSSGLGVVSHVVGATLDTGGNVLAGVATVTGATTDGAPAIARLGANALVAFTSGRAGHVNTYAVRVTAALPLGVITRLDASDLLLAGNGAAQAEPAVAAAGTSWLVAWRDDRNHATSGSDIYGGRVSSAGAALDGTPIVIANPAGDDHAPGLAFDGSQWLVTWTGDLGQFARAVATGGTPGAGTATVSSAHPLAGLGAWGGDPAHAIVAWSDPGAGGVSDLLGRRIESGLSFGLAFPLATQTPNQTEPAIAFGAGHWGVAWVDDRFGSSARQIRIGFTDSARFEAPNPTTVGFAVPRVGLDQGHPSLVYDGTNFNLFWDESRAGHLAVMGARFTAGGALIDTFTVSGGAWNQYEPVAVSFADGHVQVAWTDARVGPTERDIWIVDYLNGAVSPGGTARALANVVGVREEHPSAANLTEFATIVVYETSSGGLDRGIESVTISRSINVDTPYHDTVIKDVGHTYQHPSLASNGVDMTCAYEEVVFSDGPALHKASAKRYDSTFGFWYAFSHAVDPGSYTPANPVIGSAGYDYVEMWSTLTGGGPDVLVRGLGPYEDFTDPNPTRLTSDPIVDTPGAVAQGQSDRLGLAYLRAQNSATWSGLQLFGGDARDTLVGAVLINEFLAHPASDRAEFYELFNTRGSSFFLNGWKLRVDGVPNEVVDCSSFLRKKGPVVEGTPCGTIEANAFLTDSTFFGWSRDPAQGFLPDRGAELELVSPGGVVVDEVGYGYRGPAPVSGAVPVAIAPADLTSGPGGQGAKTAGGGAQTQAAGDSTSISTARLPNGTNTGSNANDFNLTGTTTPNSVNQGSTAALGTTLFVTRAYWYPLAGQAVVELYNPSTSQPFDFTGWYLSNNNATEQIGIAGNAWSTLKPQDKRILRGGERGSFTFKMDELSVLYLLGPDFTRYEQLAWSRPDNLAPDLCVTRVPDTGGFHDGFDWFSCGGQDDVGSGQIRYTTCSIEAPATDVPKGPATRLSFAGAWPNPARASRLSTLVFTLPGATGATAVRTTLALYDVAGRRVSTLVDAALPPGEHRVALSGATSRGRVLRAGTYYAELTVGGERLKRTVVLLP